MILDLGKFLQQEKPYWDELESFLNKDFKQKLDLDRIKRFQYLHQRASAALAQLMTYSSEQEIREYLETLVARSYRHIHAHSGKEHHFHPVRWFFKDFPISFRCHLRAFFLSCFATLLGLIFSASAVSVDPGAKAIILPFEHLQQTPEERVEKEEQEKSKSISQHEASFSTSLMTHNIKTSIFAIALGITFGAGTLIILFYNGAILGAVGADYLLAGQADFLFGWLLPHGAVEIPAFLIAGQAGLVFAHVLFNKDSRKNRQQRFKEVGQDLTFLVYGIAIMLIWAGIIESFFSQYHQPILPYSLKICFGVGELILLTAFLSLAGKGKNIKN
jgi:uncharacterized membrane protein SpoIIM required for sporulation